MNNYFLYFYVKGNDIDIESVKQNIKLQFSGEYKKGDKFESRKEEIVYKENCCYLCEKSNTLKCIKQFLENMIYEIKKSLNYINQIKKSSTIYFQLVIYADDSQTNIYIDSLLLKKIAELDIDFYVNIYNLNEIYKS